jgi:hypothetical protein
MLLVYFLGIFKIVTPYIAYKLNYKYISTVLCENKKKPQMECNGKCHLSKELKKAAQEESSSKSQATGKSQENESTPAADIILLSMPFEWIAKTTYPFITKDLVIISLDDTTPPPKV